MINGVMLRNVSDSEEDYLSGDVRKEFVSIEEISRTFGVSMTALQDKSENELFWMAAEFLEGAYDYYVDQAKLDEVFHV